MTIIIIHQIKKVIFLCIESGKISYNIIGQEPKNPNFNNRNNTQQFKTNNFNISSFALSSSEINHYEFRAENPTIRAKKDSSNESNKSKILRQLPENKIKDLSKLNDENKACIFCLEDYKINDNTIVLPYFHFFHENCIKNWVKARPSCPLCKLDIKKYI